MDISDSGLHIINNPSAAASWVQAFHKTDRLLVQQDMLSCGPTPQCQSLAEWENIRVAYLEKIFGDEESFNFGDIESDLLTNAERLRDYDSVLIWAGTGIEDQILILFVIYLADMVNADTSKIKLIQFANSSQSLFIRMAELIPEKIRDHPPPRSLKKSNIQYLRSVWFAITSNNPMALQKFLNNDNKSHPFIANTIKCLIRRYPQLESGLPYWDWNLVKNTEKHSPSAAHIIGHTMTQDLEDGDHVGDLYLFYRLRKLAEDRNKCPLIELHGKQESLRDTSVTLTDFGKSVANGEVSSYPTNAIDEWIGGVHLSSEKGNLWFYEDGKIVPANNYI